MTLELPLLLFLISLALTEVVRRYSIWFQMIDVPNGRSSHVRPTPRGGGLAVVLVFLGYTIVRLLTGGISFPLFAALVGGGVPVALAGWLDDKYHLSARLRLTVHVLAAAWAVWVLGGLPSLSFGLFQINLGVFGYGLATVGVVWLINLYNFMDGIDGLAAGQAVLVSLAGGGMLALGGNMELSILAIALSAASAGFLLHNWQPARIFMGDVCSGFLGFSFGVFAIASENSGSVPVMIWAVLLAVFIFDTTLTLLRRILAGERWYDAHRSHAYQGAVQAGYSHAVVTLTVLGIDLLLVGLALLAWRIPITMLGVLLLVSVGLVLLWLKHGRIQGGTNPDAHTP